MVALRQFGLLAEDDVEVFQPGAVLGQLATADRRTGLAVTALFGVGQVDGAVLGELRRQHHIQQAALALGPDLGHTADRRADLAFGIDHPQVAGTLGDQHVLAARQERQGPGIAQAVGQGADGQGAFFTAKLLFGRRLRQKGQDCGGGQGYKPGCSKHAGFLS